MRIFTIALFGEAEKGEFNFPYFCESLPQLVDCFGNPPSESRGLYYAVQTLLYHHNLIFLRVQEEGFSTDDYLKGLHYLADQQILPKISAIGLPGAGQSSIIEAVIPICKSYHSILLTNEADLYDYLTEN